MGEIEELDIKIIEILSKKGRRSFRKIAKDLDKSPSTIISHLEKLKNLNIIQSFTIDVDFKHLGYEVISFIELKLRKGSSKKVYDILKEDPHIFGIYQITGEYDLFILARFKKGISLNELIKNLNNNPDISRTNTHLILNVLKNKIDFSNLFKSERDEDNP